MTTEIYPRAPVQFVAFHAGFPLSPLLQSPGGKEQVYERLSDAFPILDTVEGTIRFQLPIGGGQAVPQSPMTPGPPQQLRMSNRERTRAVTLGPRMVLLECTDHESFEHLRQLLHEILTAVATVGSPSGLREVSLQYVDEIRHPSASTPAEWNGLILPSAIGAIDLLAIPAQQTAGLAVYQLSEQQQLRVSYNAAQEGFAVDPNGPLRVAHTGSGPHFRIDLESQWNAPADSVPPFDVQGLLTIANDLHAPIRDAFEKLIEDPLREYFRGGDEQPV